jgi:hypothetical protein
MATFSVLMQTPDQFETSSKVSIWFFIKICTCHCEERIYERRSNPNLSDEIAAPSLQDGSQ